MQRRIDRYSRSALWLERLVWNGAAGAALAVMVLVLLWSLQWLDRVAPASHPRAAVMASPQVAAPAPVVAPVEREQEVADVNRPSG